MAIQIKVQGARKAEDVWNVDPLLITVPENLTRYFDHDTDAIDEMVRSYEERGQDTPVMCRRTADKGLTLVYGQCRVKAAIKYNELHPDNKMTIATVVCADNEDDALMRAIDENMIRSETSIVDQSFTMKRLIEGKKWAPKDVAAKFRCSQAKVSRCLKITALRKSILKMLHADEITFETACDLADLNDTSQDEILAQAKARVEEWEAKQEQWLSDRIGDARKIDETVPEPAKKGDKPANGEVEAPTKPTKRNNAQPGGTGPKPKPEPKPTVNKAAQEAIRKKKEAAAEKAAASGAKPSGNGKKVIDPPTFVQLKRALKEEFLDIKNCPEPVYTLMALTLEFMEGKVTQAAWAKDMKAESKKYDFKEPDQK